MRTSEVMGTGMVPSILPQEQGSLVWAKLVYLWDLAAGTQDRESPGCRVCWVLSALVLIVWRNKLG